MTIGIVLAALVACASGADLVALMNCVASPSQAFEAVNGTIMATGLCLTALGFVQDSSFSMLPCNGSSAQQFVVNDDATITLHDYPGMCLDGRETNVTGSSVHLWQKLGMTVLPTT
jgi:hypothetical protein